MNILVKLVLMTSILTSANAASAAAITACGETECTNYFKQYKRYAKQGHSHAMVTLGELYYQGYGTKKDLENALRYFKRGAKYGRIQGMNKAGLLYLTEPELLDIDEGLKYLKKAARKGHASSALLLAVIYYNPDFGPQDIEEADKWLAKSYEKGYGEIRQYITHIVELKQLTANQFPELFEEMAESPVKTKLAIVADNNNSQAAYANKVVWPKGDVEVIEVTAPSLKELFDNDLARFKSTTPDRHLAQASTGTNIVGRTCEHMVSCNTASKEDFKRLLAYLSYMGG